MKTIKVYVAGKMSKHSHYESHTWRDEFLEEISRLSGVKFISYDPTNATKDYTEPEMVFGSDIHMINEVDLLIAYLSDDFAVGGSQEILIAKYFGKPVIGLAPYGGKFNNDKNEVAGEIIYNFRHPFVYSTCDVVCDDIKSVAKTVKNLDKIKPKNLKLIDQALKKFDAKHTDKSLYEIRNIQSTK